MDPKSIGSAEKNDIWQLETVDIRDFSTNRHRTVDDTPTGGGPGMVLKPDIADAAIESVAPRPGSYCVLRTV